MGCRNLGSNSSLGVTRLWVTHLDYALVCSKEPVLCKYSIFGSPVVARRADKAEPILDFISFPGLVQQPGLYKCQNSLLLCS